MNASSQYSTICSPCDPEQVDNRNLIRQSTGPPSRTHYVKPRAHRAAEESRRLIVGTWT